MARGNDGQVIFRDDAGHRRFLNLLTKAKERFRFRLYAYCLMSNHFHLLLHVTSMPLSPIMQWLLTCHASWFNRRWQRKGHLFQERFEAIHCQQDSYFLELLRYIHLNPVRADLVSAPDRWPWSGHREIIGTDPTHLIDKTFPLSLFHRDSSSARMLYADFIDAGIPDCHRFPDPFRQGRSAAQFIVEDHAEDVQRGSPRTSLSDIAGDIARESGFSLETLRRAGRARTLARARRLLVRRAIDNGHRPYEIAALLSCSLSLVSKALRSPWPGMEGNMENT